MSDTTPRGIRIQVEPEYRADQSDPDRDHYLFAYRIRISNVGEQTATLRSRHWVITNANGHTEEVRGPGVVGEEPELAPGEAFEYVSYCPLNTPVGTMHGSYRMEADSGEHYDAKISVFRLAVPGLLN